MKRFGWIMLVLAATLALQMQLTAQAQEGCVDGEWLVDGVCTNPAELPAGAEWLTVTPGGDTRCALNTPYQFRVTPGTDDLLIYLADGGICQDGESCQPESGQYQSAVAWGDPETYGAGILDRNNADNLFADYTVIVLPSCTGDMFMGNQETTYDDTLVIQHRGFVNLEAGLDFSRQIVDDPQLIVVAGSGSGASGAVLAAAIMSETFFPGKPIVQIGDSTEQILLEPVDIETIWGLRGSLSRRMRGLVDTEAFTLPDLYAGVAPAFGRVTFAMLNSRQTPTQTGDTDPQAILIQALSDTALNVASLRYMLVDSDVHNLLITDAFYSAQAEGVPVRDWVAARVAGEPVENVPQDQAALNRRLATAVDSADLAMVLTSLEEGADPNMAVTGRDGYVLLTAVDGGEPAIVDALLAAGSDPLLPNRQGYNALHLAARAGNVDIVLALLPYVNDIDVLSDTQYGENALQGAAATNQVAVVQLLLDRGADVNLGDKHGDPALNWAVYYGHEEAVRVLIAAGADINAHSDAGTTALATARRQGHAAIEQILLDAGALE